MMWSFASDIELREDRMAGENHRLAMGHHLRQRKPAAQRRRLCKVDQLALTLAQSR